MKSLPPVSQDRIISLLAKHYDILGAELTFVPRGEDAYGFIVAAQGVKYFAKLWPKTSWALRLKTPLELRLAASDLLSRNGITQISRPILRTDGKFTGSLSNHVFALFSFIEGHQRQLSAREYFELGKLVGHIHHTSLHLKISKKLRFSPDAKQLASRIVKVLKDLERKSTDHYTLRLQKLLKPHADVLRSHLDVLIRLERSLRAKKYLPVLAHGDAHFYNVLITRGGVPRIVDWDGVQLAPPEYDLWLFGTRDGIDFLRGYKSVPPACTIDLDRACYFYVRRFFEDIYDWSRKILYEQASDEQMESDLRMLRKGCMDDTKNLARNLARFRTLLHAVNRMP